MKSFVKELYSLFQIIDRIRTEYDQSKILEENEKLRSEIRTSKGLIIKILSASLSKSHILFINLIVSGLQGSQKKFLTERSLNFPKKKVSFNTKRL